MDAQTFLNNLGTIADAPGGIQHVRKLILELAVRGALVNQDASEGAQELKATVNGPFQIPQSWSWLRLSDFVKFKVGKTPPTKDPGFWGDSESTMWVSISDMTNGGFVTESARRVTKRARADVFKHDPWPTGTMLMSFKLTIGKVSRLGQPAYFNEAIMSFDSGNPSTNEFLFRVLPLLSQSANAKGAIKGNTLNSDSISNILIPLPPESEQVRIVSKVDELVDLCDELEAAKNKRASLRTAARKSAIDAISTAATAIEFKTAWERISDKWITFSDSPESLDELRFLILEIALSGRLTPHDKSWNKCRLGDLTKIRTGKLDANASSIDGKYPFFTCAKDPLRISTFSYDTECVLLAGNGNFDVNYYSGKFDAYQRTYIIESQNPNKLDVRFLFRYMQRHSRTLLAQSIGGVIKYIRIGFLTEASILVPSISTQKEVVSRIDALMKICDDLENMLEERSALSEKLLAGLGQLNPPAA
jgi:restriction endonuclease S subunit